MNSIFVYPEGLKQEEYQKLKEFNQRASSPFDTLVVYGIYVYYEEYVDISFSIQLEELSSIPNITNIFLIVEGQVSSMPLEECANVVQQLGGILNKFPMVTGLCFDFEPMDTMMKQLLGILCLLVNERWILCCYGSAVHGKQIMNVIGNNGFYILNGYDLGNRFLETHSPKEYKKKLERVIQNFIEKNNHRFTVAIPAIGTGNEFTRYQRDGQVYENKHKNFDDGCGYLEAAVKVLQSIRDENFIGHTIWAITGKVEIKGVSIYPASIFEMPGLCDYLSKVKYN
ncbi:hypothetical protein HDV04_001521 [Boothiomyces sp. JEL0838]|nr:hypothetical protein HDV04_001521 [Boothiomyces sp. JEL0838]